jgi:hypothetical protein
MKKFLTRILDAKEIKETAFKTNTERVTVHPHDLHITFYAYYITPDADKHFYRRVVNNH